MLTEPIETEVLERPVSAGIIIRKGLIAHHLKDQAKKDTSVTGRGKPQKDAQAELAAESADSRTAISVLYGWGFGPALRVLAQDNRR